MDPGRDSGLSARLRRLIRSIEVLRCPIRPASGRPCPWRSKLDNLLTVAASLAEGRLQRARIGGIEPVFHRR